MGLREMVGGMGLLIGLAVSVNATQYTFTPNPADIYDLDHYKAYTWGLKGFSIPAGETIVGASLFIDNINNWDKSANILYIHLLDSAENPTKSGSESGFAPTGKLTTYSDGRANGDHFGGWTYSDDVLLDSYVDDTWLTHPTGKNLAEDYLLTFGETQLATLVDYLGDDGKFGFGWDPDCHYYNDGVTFTITTRNVPDGGTTCAMLGAALVALHGLRRRFSR